MTKKFFKNGEEMCDIEYVYFERGDPSHGAEVSKVGSEVLRNEIAAQPDDKLGGVLQYLSSFCQAKIIELG